MTFTGRPAVDVLAFLALLGAAAAGVISVWKLGRWVGRGMKRVNDFLDDWAGTPSRPGIPVRHGVMERLAALEDHTDHLTVRTVSVEKLLDAQLRPNHGHSMHDQLAEVHQRVTGGDT